LELEALKMKVRSFGQRGQVIVPKSWVGKKVYVIISDYSNLAFTNSKLPTPEEFKMYDLESESLLPESTGHTS